MTPPSDYYNDPQPRDLRNEEIIRKAITKAIRGGWERGHYYLSGRVDTVLDYRAWQLYILCDHDFCKAFWSTNRAYAHEPLGKKEWEVELQTAVIQPDPIKYLEQFL